MRTPGGLEQRVAVKLLHGLHGEAEDARRRLRDEARLLAGLSHPAIPRCLDVIQLGYRVGIVLELVEGVDLGGALRAPDPPGLRAILQIVAEVAGALHTAWTAPGHDGPLRIVHRDVKPGNIRIDRHGRATLLDFGIAHFAGHHREAQTATGLVVGSLGYMAPERFVADTVGPEGDVFGLGACLAEAAAVAVGVQPLRFPRDLPGCVAVLGKRRAFEAELAACRQLPPEVGALATEMLAWRPDRRPTATQVTERARRLATATGGPTLRAWCAGRGWPPSTGAGPLVGQTLSQAPARPAARVQHAPVETAEVAAPPIAAPPPPPPQSAPSSRLPWLLALAFVLLAACTGALALVGLAL